MDFMLVRHKVKDYSKWKEGYDNHLPARRAAGVNEVYLLRDTDNSNNIVILFKVDDISKARAFSMSDDLRKTMQMAGVIDKPDIYFLAEEAKVHA